MVTLILEAVIMVGLSALWMPIVVSAVFVFIALSVIAAALLKVNTSRCRPPLSEAEVQGIARSVMRYEPAAEDDTDRAKDRLKRFERVKREVRRELDAEERPVIDPPSCLTLTERLQKPRTEIAWRINDFVEGYVKVKRRPRAQQMIRYENAFLDAVMVPGVDGQPVKFTEKVLARITADDIEKVIAAKAMRGTRTVKTKDRKAYQRPVGGGYAATRLYAHLRKLFNWAVKKDYLERSPLAKADVALVKERKRDRRLEGDEYQRLVDTCAERRGAAGQRLAANQHLRDMIDAALETGCRCGELLSLQWSQVRWLRNEIFLPGEKTKTNRDRAQPISTALRLILVRRQQGPDGKPHKPEAFVFGNEACEQVREIKGAWGSACERAGAKDLRFHDLRHEAGSRKLEAGWPIHAVSAWLGHTSITTTMRSLNVTSRQLHELNERPVLVAVR
jgi:integrase